MSESTIVLSLQQQRKRAARVRLYLLSCMAAVSSTPAFAQLTEAEGTVNWVLAIFTPGMLLAGLTILLIGCGIAVWMGKMSGSLFTKILVGSILVFGARTIAPKIVAIF